MRSACRTVKKATLKARGLECPQGRAASGRAGASEALDVLGPDSFAEVVCFRTPGRVVWCNFELARELGFDVPPWNLMTPEFHEQLLDAFCLRAVKPGEDMEGVKSVRLYADKYGGDGVRPALGAARAGFLPYGNLYIKGIGFTPLFRNDPKDFVHSHGGVHMDDCLCEAVFGEVNENLFTLGSTRAVAVIDQGRHVTFPSGERKPIALIVRTGTQLRPAHLLITHPQNNSLLEKFVRMTRATGQLVTHRDAATGADLPDLRATMLRVIDDHARTAAEQFRWRMIHGALSSSNMELSGAMLDLPTQSAQPRTAPVRALDFPDSVFGREHIERASRLAPVYRKLVRSIPQPDRQRLKAKHIDFCGEMCKAYDRHLQVKLLCAVGLKTELAAHLQAEQADLARRFMDLILRMAALKNQGGASVSRSLVESVSGLDVFNLLSCFPRKYFAAPRAGHAADIRAALKPIIKGNPHQVAHKLRIVEVLIEEFAALYGELMRACESHAKEYYGDLPCMRSSIKARAAFENQPLDALYSKRLFEELNKSVAAYKTTGDARVIQEAVDRRIRVSLRSVEGLLFQGEARSIAGGGIETEMRTIDGVSYSVRSWNDRVQTRRLHVRVPVRREGGAYLTALQNLPRLTRRQIAALRYRFTTDGWLSHGEVRARLAQDERGEPAIDFEDIRTFPPIGRLEGAFYLRGTKNGRPPDDAPRLGGYSFAIPDRDELIKMAASPLGQF